ncbi:MAG: HAMP domain-containing histidine kinase, partial [Chryseobacterium sp.]
YRIFNPDDPKGRLVQARGKVFHNHNGKTTLNGTIRDITEQKKDEQRKDDFMGMVSHELKTPLTSLNAYLQLMQRTAMLTGNTSQQKVIEKSIRQVRNMTAMINSFLNISRLDSGRMLVSKTRFDLQMLLNDLEEETLATVHTHRIFFERGEFLEVNADREKVAQVVYNLIGNAVKYSPMNTAINISFSSMDNQKVRITVKDEGMGISEEDQGQIFERYYRIKNPQIGSIAGFGIGLYFCKEIAELHQGKILVQSAINEGSAFTLEIPV